MQQGVALYALTPQGFSLATHLAKALRQTPMQGNAPCCPDIFIPKSLAIPHDVEPLPKRFLMLATLLEETFTAYTQHIFITATGIAVRSIAPHLVSKTTDPAVLVMDQKGQFVISLISGHIGRANDLTYHVASLLGATPIITTATDVEGLPAIDSLALQCGLAIINVEAVKNISAALLASKLVFLYDPDNWLGIKGGIFEKYFTPIGEKHWKQLLDSTGSICGTPVDTPLLVSVTEKIIPHNDRSLVLAPPVFCAGVGCKRGTSAECILKQLHSLFDQKGFSLASLSCLASATVKSDEQGILDAALTLGVPVLFYSAQDLEAYPVSNESVKCLETFGMRGVCEPAALAAAGTQAILEQEKFACNGITIAIARKTLIPEKR